MAKRELKQEKESRCTSVCSYPLWSYIINYLRRMSGASCSIYTINIHLSFWYVQHFAHRSFGTVYVLYDVHHPQTNEYMTMLYVHSMKNIVALPNHSYPYFCFCFVSFFFVILIVSLLLLSFSHSIYFSPSLSF